MFALLIPYVIRGLFEFTVFVPKKLLLILLEVEEGVSCFTTMEGITYFSVKKEETSSYLSVCLSVYRLIDSLIVDNNNNNKNNHNHSILAFFMLYEELVHWW